MNDTLKQINDIKNLMERSSRFLSLSGLSGVAAGLSALIGAAVAFFYLNYDIRYFNIEQYFADKLYSGDTNSLIFLLLDGFLVLFVALSSAAFFTIRKTKKSGEKLWNSASKRLLIQLFIPLITGGIFCLLLIFHGIIFIVAPATLIFYGLALLNAGKYTLNEIQWLGIMEIILGLFSTLFIGYGLVFWSIGFGVLHIIYGITMYIRYDRNSSSSHSVCRRRISC